MSSEPKQDFNQVYDRLLAILSMYAGGPLQLRQGTGQIELVGAVTPASRGREVWFGAVRSGKRYVSYHLMPVYAFPDLLDGISPGLKKRMQGKSCFNFTRIDEHLFVELSELTARGYERFKQAGLVESA